MSADCPSHGITSAMIDSSVTGKMEELSDVHYFLFSFIKTGRTPLFESARYGHEDMCKYLVGKGAQVNLQSEVSSINLFLRLSNYSDAQILIGLLVLGHVYLLGYPVKRLHFQSYAS